MKKSGHDGTIPQPAFCIPAWPRDAPSPGGDCGSAQRRDEGGVKLRIPRSAIERPRHQHLRACLETTRGAAAGDFGCGQGGEFRASPQRAVRNEPTPATGKRPAARRVCGEKAIWLRPARECLRICSSLAPRLSEKFLAANVIGFMFMTTKAMSYQISHSERFDNPFGHSMFQNPLLRTR